MNYYLACDLGSSQCKTALLNEDGDMLRIVHADYPSHYPRDGWVEQDPEDWYAACAGSIRRILTESGIAAGDVKGVGIVGVSHNAVLLDRKELPVAKSILIYDTRSREQVRRIGEKWDFARIRERTLNDITTVWTWPQLLWIREERSDLWDRTEMILFQKDYVRNRLAPSRCTDHIDAHGSLLFDPVENRWIPEYCDDLGVRPGQLPGIASPMEIVGEISGRGAEDTGLKEGTPVITGTTDTVAEVLGAGGIKPGIGTMKLASVGRITLVRDAPILREHILNYRHVIDGLWYPGTASKSAAFSFRWFKELILPGNEDPDIYRKMDEEAGKIGPGSDGLIFHPHILGEWAPHWNDRMRANFVGLQARHTRGNLIRSVLEGVAFSLKDAFGDMGVDLGSVEEFRLIGQGAKSGLWSRIVTDVFGRDLSVPENKEAVFGAGLLTIMGITGKSLDDFTHLLDVRTCYTPDRENSELYGRLFDVYREADRSLLEIYERLRGF